jgi:hypothetical protein
MENVCTAMVQIADQYVEANKLADPGVSPPPEVVEAAPMHAGLYPVSLSGPSGSPLPMVAPVTYQPAFYSQLPPFVSAAPGKPGEVPAYYPQIYVMAAAPTTPIQEPGSTGYYPAAIMPYGQPYSAYMIPQPIARVEDR